MIGVWGVTEDLQEGYTRDTETDMVASETLPGILKMQSEGRPVAKAE